MLMILYFSFPSIKDFDAFLIRHEMELPLDLNHRISDYGIKNDVSLFTLIMIIVIIFYYFDFKKYCISFIAHGEYYYYLHRILLRYEGRNYLFLLKSIYIRMMSESIRLVVKLSSNLMDIQCEKVFLIA